MIPFQKVESSPLSRQINNLAFGILTKKDTRTIAVTSIDNSDLYKLQEPVDNGPLDMKMGIGNKTGTCKTCN